MSPRRGTTRVRRRERPDVLLVDGDGESLVVVPVLVCLALVVAMLLGGGASTAVADQPSAASCRSNPAGVVC